MAFTLVTNITIADVTFDFVNHVDIKTGFRRLTDVATIILPRNVKVQNEGLKDLFERGAPVTIQLGYDGNLNTEFKGFVAHLKPEIPFIIECEDSMFLLKQNNFNLSFKAVTLKELLSVIVPANIPFETLDVNLGKLRLTNISTAKVLAILRSKYGLFSYFKGDTLQVGFAHQGPSQSVNYNFQQNTKRTNLEYRLKDESKIKVKATSILPNNTKIEIELGDDDGEQRTLTYFDIDEAELKRRAEAEIERLKVDGYRGNITTFGVPFIQHGDISNVVDEAFPERAGAYLTDAVNTRFGARGTGFERTVELGKRTV